MCDGGGGAGGYRMETSPSLSLLHGDGVGCGLEGRNPQDQGKVGMPSPLQDGDIISTVSWFHLSLPRPRRMLQSSPCQHCLAPWHGWVPGPWLKASGPEPREASW